MNKRDFFVGKHCRDGDPCGLSCAMGDPCKLDRLDNPGSLASDEEFFSEWSKIDAATPLTVEAAKCRVWTYIRELRRRAGIKQEAKSES